MHMLLSGTSPVNTLAIFGMVGGMEWVILAILGLLLFGRRLPEVGRSLGRSIVEFRKGIKGIEDEIDHESTRRSSSTSSASSNAPRGTLPSGSGESQSVGTRDTVEHAQE